VGAGIASRAPQGRSGVHLYWQTLGVLTFFSLIGTALGYGMGPGLVVLALGLPLVQLVASLLAGLIVALHPQSEVSVREVDPIWGPEPTAVETKRDRLWAVARITGYTIGGTLLGILIMWLTCMGFGGWR
jgi:hypothetical protein